MEREQGPERGLYLIRREKIKEANRSGNRNKHHRQDEEVTATRIEDGADNKTR